MSNDEFEPFDPVRAFEQAMNDIVSLVNTFDKTDAVTPMEFLLGLNSISDRIRAIVLVTLTGAMTVAQHKIPDEVRAEYDAQRDLESLMSSPEDERKRLLKALKRVHVQPPTK